MSTAPVTDPTAADLTASNPTAAASWTVGDVTVHRVDEVLLSPATGPWLLPDATPDLVAAQDWLHPHFADDEGLLRLHSHSFAFALGGLRVLVDTGIGNGKERANPAWHNLDTDYLRGLADAGFDPDSVDLVILTHLHADHVGWNTRNVNGTWVPTFPRARYLTSRDEREFWAGYEMEPAREQMFRDSVIPVEEAGLLDLVNVPAEGADVAPGLRLLPTPGHTPGHVAVELTSHGRTALITGDCVHHPVQLADPGIGACVDIDPRQSEASRRTLLAGLVGTDTLVLGTHFAPPTAGHVVHHEGGYRFSPVSGASR
ncbi:MBL fold metallo-hydrolase [Catenulispora sp. NL8]|uniref:MBL fold metallo-hydrolase n=1 Tax=Catenulispora pinistramenti TaxID=2705254 RepID=A0ABS5KLL6_9ACTN|nr:MULTISPECIES: MBL fold metallo-hydrolase [Catenulispora]MBS2546926.1 MBL fold metallo-hydrolase [Catenulispora pinistramenti]